MPALEAETPKPEQEEIAQHQNAQPQEQDPEHTPTIIKAVAGFGAWMAAGFILSFISAFFAFASSGPAWAVFGLFLIGGAFALRRIKTEHKPAFSIFKNQVSLAFMFAGKAAFCFGILYSANFRFDSLEGVFMLLLIVSSATYPFYPSAADRFLGVFLTASLAYIAPVVTGKTFFLWLVVAPDAFYALTFALALYVFINKRKPLFPMAYALVAAGAFNLANLPKIGGSTIIQQSYAQVLIYWPKFLLITAALVFVWLHLKQTGKINQNSIIKLVAGFFILCLFNMASIVGIALACAGRHTQNKLLLCCGYAAFGSGLSFFYYNLNTSLMTKSLILFFSGLAALAAALIIKKAGEHYAK